MPSSTPHPADDISIPVIKSAAADLYDFFNLDEEDYYFPYETVLYELEGKSLYIIAFIQKSVVTDNFQDVNFIIKFSFKSFDEDSFEIIKKVEYNNYIDQMSIGTFFMDDCGILVTISSFETTADWSKQCLITNFPKLDYILKLKYLVKEFLLAYQKKLLLKHIHQ